MKKIISIFTIVILTYLSTFSYSDTIDDSYDTPTVANMSVDTYEISYEELYAIFTLSMKSWRNGIKIKIIMMSDNEFAHRFFIENYLGIGRSAYKRRLENAIASGRSNPPIVVTGNLEMIKKLRSIKGSIGYLDGKLYLSRLEDESIILITIK